MCMVNICGDAWLTHMVDSFVFIFNDTNSYLNNPIPQLITPNAICMHIVTLALLLCFALHFIHPSNTHDMSQTIACTHMYLFIVLTVLTIYYRQLKKVEIIRGEIRVVKNKSGLDPIVAFLTHCNKIIRDKIFILFCI
jgi:hypothetical protein